jgi:hypothetical protein
MSRNRKAALLTISKALIDSGCTTLDAQARALGLSRSTAWTVINCKHKTGRLSKKTIGQILASAELPASVRSAAEAYAKSTQPDAVPRRKATTR